MNKRLTLLLSSLLFLLSGFSCQREKPLVNPEASFVHLEAFPSKYVRSRAIDIWLPPAYSRDHKYPVLYMHDGQMLFDSSSSWNRQEWGVDEVMTKLILEQRARPAIIVGIANTGPDRHAEYFPQQPFQSLPEAYRKAIQKQEIFPVPVQSDAYLKFIVEELKPYIDKKFSSLPDRSNTFIAGSSMGGLISIYAVCEYPEIFGGAACLSTHWVGLREEKDNPIPASFLRYLAKAIPFPGKHKIYFDYGTETLDAAYEPYQLQVDSIMVLKDYDSTNWKTLKFPGADHSERSWNKRLDIPLGFLLSK